MSRTLKMRAAFRRFSQSQSTNAIQNSVSQVGTDASERATPSAEVGRFSKFNAEAGKYEFTSDTGTVQVDPSRMLNNGKLGAGQRVLMAQEFADFSPNG